jgi:hypothetical protein
MVTFGALALHCHFFCPLSNRIDKIAFGFPYLGMGCLALFSLLEKHFWPVFILCLLAIVLFIADPLVAVLLVFALAGFGLIVRGGTPGPK